MTDPRAERSVGGRWQHLLVAGLVGVAVWFGGTIERADAGEFATVEMEDSDRVPVGESPVRGRSGAPVTVVVFSDLSSKHGGSAASMLVDLQKRYPTRVRVVFKHYPIPDSDDEPRDVAVHYAAEAAARQGAFWAFHDALTVRQDEHTEVSEAETGRIPGWELLVERLAENPELRAPASLLDPESRRFLESLGLDVETFLADLRSASVRGAVAEDVQLAHRLGVRAIPQFIVNGTAVSGFRSTGWFAKLVDEKLAAVDRMRDRGVAPSAMYRKAVAANWPVEKAFVEVAVRDEAVCARRESGLTQCWSKERIERARVDEVPSEMGRQLVPGVGYDAIVGGAETHCGFVDGRLDCWGKSYYLTVGYSVFSSREEDRTITAVGLGPREQCAALADGGIICSKGDSTDEVGDPEVVYRDVARMPYFLCLLDESGELSCHAREYKDAGYYDFVRLSEWDRGETRSLGDLYGRDNPPEGTFESMALGLAHGCAVRKEGTVACWGWDLHGQASPPDGQFAKIDAGGAQTCGIRVDGSLACWGAATTGTRICKPESAVAHEIPSGAFIDVSVGTDGACAVRRDQSVVCWGERFDGNLADFRGGDDMEHPVRDRVASGGDAPETSGEDATGEDTTGDRGDWPEWEEFVPTPAIACGRRSDGSTDCFGGAGEDRGMQHETFASPVVDIVGGSRHLCFLHEDGRVQCRGDGASPATVDDEYDRFREGYGADQACAPDRTFEEIAAGGDATCGRTVGGAVVCWGTAPVPTDGFDGESLAVGDRKVCAVAEDGALTCEPRDPRMSTSGEFTDVVASEYVVCGLREDGTIECTDDEDQGQPPEGKFVSLEGGEYTFCAERAAGGWVCWGNGLDLPSDADAVLRVTARASCVDGVPGPPVCTGSLPASLEARLGSGAPDSESERASDEVAFGRVSLETEIASLTAGAHHTCAVTGEGEPYCWGAGDHGQLGSGGVADRGEPVRVPSVDDAVALDAGAEHTCAVDGDGAVYCWGDNTRGEVDPSGRDREPSPVRVDDVPPATAVGVGRDHTCAVSEAGRVHCWGAGSDGQLGDGRTRERGGPVRALGLGNVVDVVAAGQLTCAHRASGVRECWGAAEEGEPDWGAVSSPRLNGGSESRYGQVDEPLWERLGMSPTFGYGLTDGRVQIFESPPRPLQLRRPRHLDFPYPPDDCDDEKEGCETGRLRAVAAGQAHLCVGMVDGRVRCWGTNDHGEAGSPGSGSLEVPTPVDGVDEAVELAAGWHHTCARLASGGVVCWGREARGRLGGGGQ